MAEGGVTDVPGALMRGGAVWREAEGACERPGGRASGGDIGGAIGGIGVEEPRGRGGDLAPNQPREAPLAEASGDIGC